MDIAIDSKWVYFPEKNKLIEDGRVLIEGDNIVYSGSRDRKEAGLARHDKYVFDRGITLPGFINAHTHLPETLLRGLCDDQTLQVWLYDYVWKVEPEMTSDDAYWGSMLGIAEMISSGTIGFNDQYFYSGEIARAVSETGIKAYLSPSIFYNGNPEAVSMEEAFDNAMRTFNSWNGKKRRLWIGLGPHAPYTVDREWFVRLGEEARHKGISLHTHLNETETEVQNAIKNWGMRPIEWMNELGVLDVIGSAAHCTHLSDREIQLLKEHKVSVLHCPKSNLKIGAGIANIPELLKADINVCLGTDGQASNNKLDIIEELALEVLLHKGVQRDPMLIPSNEAIKMVTVNASKLFPDGVYSGTLEAKTRADIVVIDLDSLKTTPVINPVSHLTYAIGRENVAMTVVDGEILYHQGKLFGLNSEEIKRKAQKATENMIEKAYG